MRTSKLESGGLTAGPGNEVIYEYYGFDLLQIWSSLDTEPKSIDRGDYKWGSVTTKTVIKDYTINGIIRTTEMQFTDGFTSAQSNKWQCKNSDGVTIQCPGDRESTTGDASTTPQSSMAVQVPGTMITSSNCGDMGDAPTGYPYCMYEGQYKEDYEQPVKRKCDATGTCFEIHGPFQGVLSADKPVNQVSQIFNVPTNSGTSYKIRARLWGGDSWNDNENVYIHAQDPGNLQVDPAPQVIGQATNCVWNRAAEDADVQPQSASINKWQKYNGGSIYNPYYEGPCYLSSGKIECSSYVRPCYLDVEFTYYTEANQIKITFGSNIDQGVGNVGNGMLNEWWGFSRLEIDADIPATAQDCPGSECAVRSCVKWPGSFETAIGYGYCDTEDSCGDDVYKSEIDSNCQNYLTANQMLNVFQHHAWLPQVQCVRNVNYVIVISGVHATLHFQHWSLKIHYVKIQVIQ